MMSNSVAVILAESEGFGSNFLNFSMKIRAVINVAGVILLLLINSESI